MLEPMEKIKVARRYLFTRKPFFGSLLAELDSKGGMVIDPSVKTMSTNGRTIRWNPAFVKTLTVDEITGVIAHELLHIALGHTLRRGKRSHHLWNIATDWAINDVLTKDGFRLPEGVLRPPSEQAEKSAESNHDHLKRMYDDKPPSQPGQKSDNKSDNEEESEDEPPEDGEGSGDGDDESDEQDNKPNPKGQPQPDPDGDGEDDGDEDEDGDPQEGSGKGSGGAQDEPDDADDPDEGDDDESAPDEAEEPPDVDADDEPDDGDDGEDEDGDSGGGSGKPKIDAPKWGEVEDEPDAKGKPMDDSTREKAIRQRAVSLVEAIRAAGKDTPESLQRMVNEVIEGKADWRQILKQFCTETMKINQSWRRPNRRFIGQDVYLPSPDGQGLGEQVIVLDVSGSIRDQDLKRFQREIRKQMTELPPTKVHILWHDDAVLKHVEMEGNYESLSLSGPGGGGTDFTCVTEYLEEKLIKPKCMVWFTDLETYFWPDDPMIPTLFVVWPCHYSWAEQKTDAPWGQVAVMPQEEDT